MGSVLEFVGAHPLVSFVLLGMATYALLGIRVVGNHEVGIVEKRVSASGSVRGGFIALAGEAGFQPDVLRGGVHYLPAGFFRLHRVPLVTIAQGRIGYVFARDGEALSEHQTLASNERATDFEDVRGFLANGGQKGPQRKVLREGTYAIHLAQFAVITEGRSFGLVLDGSEPALFQHMAHVIAERGGFVPLVLGGREDVVGIVTVHDGPALSDGEIIAPVVGQDREDADTFHDDFQDPEAFLRAGGRRGRQLKTLVEGTYYLNRLFATVELVPKTVIDVGHVGVVVSYVGENGADLTGEEYSHGELVRRTERGVWSEPLLPGKYAFNTFAGKVIVVPTTNFILKWSEAEMGNHRFDENLAEVSLITKDAFEPSLPLSVVVHIDYRKAPLVIQRFGDVKKLVEQTLDPMVSAYFKNVGQTRTLIDLLQERNAIQASARDQMRLKFAEYNLELEEVLIGTPRDHSGVNEIDRILAQLRSRQVADEQIETYERMQRAAVKERDLREAEARAQKQTELTASELSIDLQKNQGRAELARAEQRASEIRAIAEAEATRTRLEGEGEASRIRALASAEAERRARVGVAEALAIEEQVRAYGGPRLRLTQEVMTRFADAIRSGEVDIVPRVVVGADASSRGNALESMLTLLLSDRLALDGGSGAAETSDATRALRDELKRAS